MRQRQTFFFPRRSTTTTFLPTHLSSHFSCGYLLLVILPSPKYPEVPEGMPQVPTLPSWILLNMLWKSPWSTVCIFYFMNLYTNLQSVSAFVKCQEQKKRKTQFNISIGIPHNAKSFASNPLRLPGTNPPRMKPKDAGTAAHPSVLTWSRPCHSITSDFLYHLHKRLASPSVPLHVKIDDLAQKKKGGKRVCFEVKFQITKMGLL